MSKRSHKRAVKLLKARRADYDAMKTYLKEGRRRPGSTNPRKAGAAKR